MSDWFDGNGGGNPVDVAAVMDSTAAELLWEVVALGALVSVGTTSDGGALGVTVTVDGRWRREYFRDTEALTEWLASAVSAVGLAKEASTASSARRERPRRSRGL